MLCRSQFVTDFLNIWYTNYFLYYLSKVCSPKESDNIYSLLIRVVALVDGRGGGGVGEQAIAIEITIHIFIVLQRFKLLVNDEYPLNACC